MTKTTNHVIKKRIPRWWLHVDLMQLNIKPRDRPVVNISHNEKCAKATGANAHCSLGHVPEESLAPLDELCNTQENHQSES